MHQQIRSLERGAHVVIATPGRALDHMRRGTLKLDALAVLILDEADEMLDMGFADDLDAILEATPQTRQTALFSATLPARILAIAQRHLKHPARVTIAHEKTVAGKMPRVRQIAYIVPRAHKPAALDRVLDMEDPASAIVFCRTRLEVDTLLETLTAHGHRAQALHGGMEQRQRDRVMQQFRGGKTDLLVATDVAARGSTSSTSRTSSTTTSCRRRRPMCTGLAARAGPDARARRSRSPSRASTGCCAASRRSRNRESKCRPCRRSPTCARGGSISRARRCANASWPAIWTMCP